MPDPADAVQAQLAKLRRKYGLALPDKISGIQAALAPLLAGTWDEQVCSTSYRQLHSLAGSSGTYGYPEIGVVAHAAETLLRQCLEARAPFSETEKTRIDDLMAQLREMAADAARQVSA